MLLDQVSFDGVRGLAEDGPVRLDIACFLGFLAPRAGVAPAPALRDWLSRQGYLSRDESDGTVPVSLLDRPVPLRSVADAEAYFDLDARLDRGATLTGAPLAADLDGLPPFAVVADGVLSQVSLDGIAADAGAIVAALEAGLPSVTVRLEQSPTGPRLSVSLPGGHGPGTLSVLAHPALGFAAARHIAAQPVGTAMGSALRQFFATGGRDAVVISLGAPPPVLSDAAPRADLLARLLAAERAFGGPGPAAFQTDFPPAHMDAAARSGLTHLYGLEDVGMLLLPDLPDLCARTAPAPAPLPDGPRPIAAFAEDGPLPSADPDSVARALPVPVCDAAGQGMWVAALERIAGFLGSHRRDVICLAAQPRLAGGVARDGGPRSELVMLTAPFVWTPHSDRLPGQAMGADAVLAAQAARRLGSATPHGSVAAEPVQGVRAVPGDVPRDADHLCALVRGPRDIRFVRDVTTDASGAWRGGPARRMMARLLKHAARLGDGLVFEPVSDQLMRQVAMSFTNVLAEIAAQNGLRPGRDDPGFTVLCDRTNNTQAELALGRLRADVGFRPASPVEMIHVTLPLGDRP